MSHEIRTPMNGILGMTKLALDTRRGQTARISGNHPVPPVRCLQFINDILDFSKLEAREADAGTPGVRSRETGGRDSAGPGAAGARKRLGADLSVQRDLPARLLGDPTALRQILVNLIGNGIKFTDQGEVTVVVRLEAEDEDSVAVHFVVADTGSGIPAAKQASIFDAFVQVDGSSTRRHGGTGLGLAICGSLVKLMDGKIWVNSEPGKGSLFHFTARFGHVAGEQAKTSERVPKDLTGARVLVVDDNATNRKILVENFKRWGMEAVAASSGAQALQIAREADRDHQPFKLILVDFQMPGMDGLELVRRMLSQSSPTPPPIMMLSSVGWQVSSDQCEELGISVYLTKPVTTSTLFDAIVKILSTETQTMLASPAPVAGQIPAGQNLKILVVEDDATNRVLATNILRRNGYGIAIARDGLEAVAICSEELFDLILMDIQMPNMNGLEATAAIRRLEQSSSRHTPILALTAHAMDGDRERCIDAGMDDYLSKPIHGRDLLSKIHTLISLGGSRGRANA